MTACGLAVSMDKVSELLNSWNKGCTQASKSDIACEQSSYVLLMCKYAYKVLGKRDKRPPRNKASQEEDVEKCDNFLQDFCIIQ